MKRKIVNGKIRFRDLNFKLILYVLVLSAIGILVVHSATVNEVSNSIVSTTVKQIIGVAGGICILLFFLLVDYHKITDYSWIFYILAVGLLIYVLLFTKAISGAHRWIHIPLLGTIQPSEFAKPALILFLAFVAKLLDRRLKKWDGILILIAASLPVLLLVLKEPDLSTSIVLILILFVILFMSGIPYKQVGIFLAAMVLIIAFFLFAVYQENQPILNAVFEPHQVERINAYFFPDDYPAIVYQQRNSLMAIGSGGFFGKGLNNSSLESVKNGNFLSEEQCDFIFSVIGEELGFFGCLVVITLLSLVCYECFKTAHECNDLTGKIIACAAGTSIAAQSFINIGVATLLIPNTGIPLPFLSAGLSSLLSTFILIGLVLNVGIRCKKKRKVFYQ